MDGRSGGARQDGWPITPRPGVPLPSVLLLVLCGLGQEACQPGRPQIGARAVPGAVAAGGSGPPCVVTGDVPAVARDTALAECRRARSRFQLLFGEEAPGADVELRDSMFWELSPEADRVRFVTYSDSVLAAVAPLVADVSADLPGQGRFIAHELLHFFFWLRSGEPAEIDAQRQYGTRAPDWFDEGIAVWGESEEQRIHWWEELVSLADSAFDLRGFAARRHPKLLRPPLPDDEEGAASVTTRRSNPCVTAGCLANPDRLPAGMVERTRVFPNGETIVDTVPAASVTRGPTVKEYYSLSYGLVRYLHARGGPAAIREVVRRFGGGWPPADSVFVDIPGLPRELDAVEADWRRWVRSAGPG